MAAPKLRFKEFDEDWSKTTLNDIAEINPPSSSLPDKFIYIDLESVKNGRLLAENNIELKNAPSRAQRLLQKDDVLFQVVRPYQQNNLYFEKEGSYVASTGYAQIRANANSSFLYHMLHEEQFLSEVINRCTGTSYPAINSKDLSSIEVYTPSLKEQTKIATFLSTVDTKIDELIQKHELLTEYKKGMMQQLFSQKLRFKADDGSDFEDWKNVKLGNILLDYKLGGNYKNSEKPTMHPLIKMGNIGRGSIHLDKIEYIIQEESIDSDDIVKLDDLFFNTRNTLELVGKVAIWRNEIPVAYYNSNLMRMKFENNRFMNYLFNETSSLKKLKAIASGTTSVAAIYTKDLLKINLSIPSDIEQTKIANFLTAIDQKIDNVAEQIDHAKTWKKGLLQQMFV